MNAPEFNVTMTIPTGVGCEIGGHAGDAGPAARLLAATCDNLIINPNVVNASDINEMPGNALYVEGSSIDRWLAGEFDLVKTRSNRIMVIAQEHPDDPSITDLAVNTANAAVATWGARISKMVRLKDAPELKAFYTADGLATATLTNVSALENLLYSTQQHYDAVAITTIIDLPLDYHKKYFDGELPINPWGGAEAVLTNWIGRVFGVPTAHAPMLESWDAWEFESGNIDPRMAAEAISCGFLHCVLKGLARAPRLVVRGHKDAIARQGGVLVIPNGCHGRAVDAARAQGLTVIEVRSNKNICKNVPAAAEAWKPGQLLEVANYFAAAGAILAIREGIDPTSLNRPLHPLIVEKA
jgi:hypothetical protein